MTENGAAEFSRRNAWVHPGLVGVRTKGHRRKVHLDFHNSHHVDRVGENFDSTDFIATLQASHVDSIVVFAKDMHGFAYYPSRLGPVHPGLAGRDLLGEQIAACKQAGIGVYAYYCTTWDNHLAARHTNWLSITRAGSNYLPAPDEAPSWTAVCLSNEDLVEHMIAQTLEVMEAYRPDGMWFDQPVPNADLECFCRNCLAAIAARGMDPLDANAQAVQMEEIFSNWLKRSAAAVRSVRSDALAEQNMLGRFGLGRRARWIANVEIEALPTGTWGYGYFPAMSRFVRGLGIPMTGMTGRFHLSWADFGGLKSSRQLTLEVASIVATGASVSIGDQPPPNGKLDPAVYRVIGDTYRRLKDLDSLLEGAVGVAEAALYIAGANMRDFLLPSPSEDKSLSEGIQGAVRLLIEQRIQFDVVEALSVPISRYRLVVVPDGVVLSQDSVEELDAYVRTGGRVMSFSHPLDGAVSPWMERLGIGKAALSPTIPAYFRPAASRGELASDFDYVVYGGAYRWEVSPVKGVRTFATLSEPKYTRSPGKYTSHAQWPVSDVTDRPAALASDTIAAFAFAVGQNYFNYGYWPYSAVFAQVLDQVLPHRIVRASGPSTLEVSVTDQNAVGNGSDRRLVHLVNFAGARRRSANHLEYHEESVPITDIELHVEVNEAVAAVVLASTGATLDFTNVDETTISFRVPFVDLHEIAVIEYVARDAG